MSKEDWREVTYLILRGMPFDIAVSMSKAERLEAIRLLQ
jgi:hypothetical protein